MEKIKIIKDISLLGTWFHLSKLINLFTFFIIAKFLSPKDFGLLNLTLGIYFFFMIFPQAISNAVVKFISEQKEKVIFVKGLKWAILFGIVLSLLMYFLSNFISNIFSQQISQYIKIISLLFFITSIYEVLKGTFLGLKKVNYFVMTETVLYISNLFAVVLLFWLGFDIYSPLYGFFIATSLAILVSFILVKKLDFSHSLCKYDYQKFFSFTKKSIVIPILSQAMIFLFVYFLTNYRPVEELGYYYFLSKITIFVLSIFPLALDKVLLPYFSEYYFKNEYLKFQKLSDAYLKITFYSLLMFSLFLYLVIIWVINSFFIKYDASVNYLILFLGLGFTLAFGTYSVTILSAMNKLRIVLAGNIVVLFVGGILSYLFIPNVGIASVAIIHMILYLFVVIIQMTFIKRKLELKYSILPNKKDLAILKEFLFRKNLSPQ